jgi:hypothetical protein
MPTFATLIARPSPAAEAAERTAERWLAGVRRGLDLLVAFATLRDAESGDDERERLGQPPIATRRRPPQPLEPTRAPRPEHPHRRPLRAGPSGRRPGAVPPPAHACRTPLAVTRPPRRRDRALGPRP